MARCCQARRSAFHDVHLWTLDEVTKAGQGISMPIAQFGAIVSLLPHIETVLKENGETIPRPEYDKVEGDGPPDVDEDTGVDCEEREETKGKKNFEQTSDEE